MNSKWVIGVVTAALSICTTAVRAEETTADTLPKPVLLVDFGETTATESTPGDAWDKVANQVAEGNFGKISSTVVTSSSYPDITYETQVLGNFYASNVTSNEDTADFSSGSYVGLDGETYTTIFDEMKATLGLQVAIDETIYKDGLGNAGQRGHTFTISGLDSSKTYVMYYIGGGLHGAGEARILAGFKLTGYSGYPNVDYVVTAAGYNTTKATAYTRLADSTTEIRAAANSYMVVRVSPVKPNGDGTISFVMHSSTGYANINALAIAEIEAEEESVYEVTEDTETSVWQPGSASLVALKNEAVDGSTLTLTVNQAIPSSVKRIAASGKVCIEVGEDAAGSATTVLYIPEDAEVTVKGGWPFSQVVGSGALILDSVTVSSDNSTFSGSCTISSGTVKMGNAMCFGPHGRTVLVKAGAILDTNGKGSSSMYDSYTVKLEEGSKYCNSAQPSSDPKLAFPFSGLILDGNAVIEAKDYNCGLTKHYNNRTTVNLREYVLTATGGKTVYFSDPTISGTGTLSITGNTTLQLARNYFSSTMNSAAKIRVESGSQINLDGYGEGPPTFSINNEFVVDGELNTDNKAGEYAVNAVIGGSGKINAPLTLGANAVIKVDGLNSLLFSVAPTSSREGGIIAVDVSSVDLTKYGRIPVLRVSEKSMLPTLDLFTGMPRGWTVQKTSDECGVVFVKPGFTIRVR